MMILMIMMILFDQFFEMISSDRIGPSFLGDTSTRAPDHREILGKVKV